MEGWGLETSLFSTGPSCVSGFGASQMKRMPYGRTLSVGSLGSNEEARPLVLLEVLLGQASGRRLERNGIQSFAMLFSLWEMAEGCASGRTFGVERRLFLILSPFCMLWLTTRRRWWRICGTLLGRKKDGSLALLNLSMIRNWMRSSVFSIPFNESKLLRVKGT